jgi:hypothetical protein
LLLAALLSLLSLAFLTLAFGALLGAREET